MKLIKEDILPKDKLDEERANKLFNFTKEELEPFIPDLLMYLQDTNWPISDIVSKLLSQYYQNELIPHLIKILQINDSEWIYNCLRFIDCYINDENIVKFKSLLERFATNPTSAEVDSEVNIESVELLKKIKMT